MGYKEKETTRLRVTREKSNADAKNKWNALMRMSIFFSSLKIVHESIIYSNNRAQFNLKRLKIKERKKNRSRPLDPNTYPQ